jgi:hypothetical protein
MLVGLFIDIAPNDPTSHGLTFKAENVVCGSIDANIAPFFVVVLASLIWILEFNREGTEVLVKEGSSSDDREILRLFLEFCESKESASESESEWFDAADSESE